MSKDLSVADLQELMVHALQHAGWSEEEVAGYVAAQRHSGWLRARSPAWLRNSAGVFYALPPAGCFDAPRPDRFPASPDVVGPKSKPASPDVVGPTIKPASPDVVGPVSNPASITRPPADQTGNS